MGLVHKLTPENAHRLIAKADALYLALHPFKLETKEEIVRGSYKESPHTVYFASPDIEKRVLETQEPMLIFQDSSAIDLAIELLSKKGLIGDKYLVPTFNGSLNPSQGMGAVHQYIEQFSPGLVNIFGPKYLAHGSQQLKEWLERSVEFEGININAY
ncbi:hypothetical protein HYU50_05540 [Candidatus Woesearchaeota archaeon]|nr:hypothetical protein [Candidatus Woesearchaeota archaeon]